MASKEKRFVTSHKEGTMAVTSIITDKVTGVNYLCVNTSNGLGLTPLLDRNGNVIVSALPIED